MFASSGHAPELPTSLQWLNSLPLTLASQRGKMILLDFWTYCCINCMRVLPDLHYLEEKYVDTLTVIGIHSPKFANEKVDGHVKKAIDRYHIQHPVAHDPTLTVWQIYGIHAWPSLVLIDTEGKIVEVLAGEGQRETLDQLIAKHLQQAQQRHTLRPAAITSIFNRTAYQNHLAFPGKVIATADKLYISDSAHHRIVETTHQGAVLRVFAEKQVNNPQGLAIQQQLLWVADTGNNALQQIDLTSGELTTLATNLFSPWDVSYYAPYLCIAMAGTHQIWLYDFAQQRALPYSGSGYEALWDGSCGGCAYAQPSGLTLHEDTLYIADAETSAIRALDLLNAQVTTLVGTGLFDYGDRDGIGKEAQLQHALGVTYDADRHALWIADSYNHKIKLLNLTTLAVQTYLLQTPLAEPGGLYYQDQQLWIADTNNHRIIQLDLQTHRETVVGSA